MGTARPSAAAEIDAPLDVVWRVMLDTERYAEWNPFVVRVAGPSPPSVGDAIVLHVRWADGGSARSPERVSVIAPPTTVDAMTTAHLAYVYEGLPARLGLVRGVRHQRLRQQGDEPTFYDTVEEFSGPLVRFAGPGRVADGFALHAAALKERAESLAGEA